jgi:hypothetical protein
MAKISVLGVDLGKNVCSVGGLDASGAVVMRRRAGREALNGWRKSCLYALSGWRQAAAPITSAVSSTATATTSG